MIGQIRIEEARHPYVLIGWWDTEAEYREFVAEGTDPPRLRVKVDLASPGNTDPPLVNASNGLLEYEDVPHVIKLLMTAQQVIAKETAKRAIPPAFSGAEGDDR